MKHNALNDCQHGFRKGRSTETALLIQKELIINNLEEGNLVPEIFIDYSKAFDCLQHNSFNRVDGLRCTRSGSFSDVFLYA